MPKQHTTRYTCEAEIAEGLEDIARQEIAAFPGTDVTITGSGWLRFGYDGPLAALAELKTSIAVYLIWHYPVPRPRALLGHEHFHNLLRQISTVRSLWPSGTFQTFSIGAAGSGSSVMTRLKNDIADHASLDLTEEDKGDLFIRLIRSREHNQGWDVLVRLTPRPLATRPYRVHNMEGALNATVAHAMALLTRPTADDIVLNIACGTGTLLIERLASGPARQAIGCDTSKTALGYARDNIATSDSAAAIQLIQCDARNLPLPSGYANVLCADLPFGQLVGAHADNITLYPHILEEAARVANHGARFALITHEIRLMEGLLAETSLWTTERVLPVTLSGLHPRIFLLRRT